MLPHMLPHKLLNLLLVWKDSDTSCRTCGSTCCRVLSHWPHVRRQVCVARSSSEQMTSLARKCVATCCPTSVQCERFQQHSRTQVEQLVASVNGSIEIPGEYKLSNKFSNLLLNLCGNMWPVWKHYNGGAKCRWGRLKIAIYDTTRYNLTSLGWHQQTARRVASVVIVLCRKVDTEYNRQAMVVCWLLTTLGDDRRAVVKLFVVHRLGKTPEGIALIFGDIHISYLFDKHSSFRGFVP